MDGFLLSQIFGTAALSFRLGSLYVQSKFPDAQRMRLSVIPAHVVTSASYAFSGSATAATSYSGAAIRSALLSTRWGNKYKNAITAFNIAAVGATTAILYESPEDILPFSGTVTAAVGDYQSQGRYNRFIYLLGRTAIWIPLAAANKNWAMLTAEIASLAIQINSIRTHDIRNAAGEKATSFDNLKSYLHGIFHDSATGADINGQVSRNTGHAPVERQYQQKLEARPNPYFNSASLRLK